MFTQEQEQQIVQKILNGDKEQYRVIVNEYQNVVANLCYKLVGNKLEVDEVTQQVFVELYTALPRFRHESRLGTFIYRITINVTSKMLKYDKRHVSYEQEGNDEYKTADYQQSYEEQIMKEEQYRKLHEAIGMLKYEQRTALVLFSFKGLSYNDIADIMQVSLPKVESLIFRAKKNLQKMLT